MSQNNWLVESFKEDAFNKEHSLGNSLGEFELGSKEMVLLGLLLPNLRVLLSWLLKSSWLERSEAEEMDEETSETNGIIKETTQSSKA